MKYVNILPPKGLLCPLPTNLHELIERFLSKLQEIDCIMDCCPTCCVAEIELQIQSLDSSDLVDENEFILLGKKQTRVRQRFSRWFHLMMQFAPLKVKSKF